MARLWQTGFELNSVTDGHESTGNNNSPSIQSAVARSGTYAFRVTSLGSGTRKGFRYSFGAAAADGPFYFRQYVRFATFPSAENRFVFLGSTAAFTSTQIVYLSIDNGGVVRLYDEDGQIGSESSALLTDTWYRIEIEFDRTPTAGSEIVRARIDGVEFAGAANRSLSAGIISWTYGGNLGAEAQTTGDWYFDDLAVNNSSGSFQNSYPGSGKIIHLRPNAAGDNSDWTNDYTAVDEVTPDDATSLVASGTLDEIDDHNIDASGLGTDDDINVVAVGTRFNAAGTIVPATFVLRVKASSGGTVEESANLAPANTTWLSNAIANPKNYPLVTYDLPGASTTAWTTADLDTAQIGYRTSSVLATSNAQVSTVWMSVDYAPVTTSVKDIIGTGILPYAR